jgi:integrase/recombinase XerC
MSRPRMFFRKQTQSYYVKIDGQFIPLGKDEQKARIRYQELLPVESRGHATDVQGFVDQYLAFVLANRSDGTYQIAVRHLTDFVAHVGKNFPVDQVRGFHLLQWADKRFSGRSDSYKNRGMSAIKACWSWGAKTDYLPVDRLRSAPMPTPGQREAFIPVDQWQTIVDTVKDQAFRDYLTVMFESGPRPQEIHQARVRHWQPEFGTLVFERKTSKGKRDRRVIPLNPASVAIVERLVAQRLGPDDHIFLNTRGRPWCKDSVNCRMRRLRAKLNIPELCAYVCRHSYAHANLVQGGDPLAVAKAMGHRDTKMIETRYGHVEKSLDYLKRGKALKVNPFVESDQPAQQVIELQVYEIPGVEQA